MKRLVPALVAVLALQACQADGDPAATTPLAPGADLTAADVGTDATNNLFARVDMLGGLTVGNRVTSVTRLGIGQYEVTFNRNMRPCAYVATNRNAYSQALNVFTAGGHLSPNGVYVETKNQGGGLTDGPFDLVATCGGTGIRYAVVGYSANLARATAGTTLSFLGGGRYQVRFPAAINTCAYLATVADPDSQLVFSPSGVYTGSGADANSVYIETKNPGPRRPVPRLRRHHLLADRARAVQRELRAEHRRLRGDCHPRLGEHGRALHPRHHRARARPERQQLPGPGPRPALLRRQPDRPGVPRRRGLLTRRFARCLPGTGAQAPVPGLAGATA